MKYFISFIVSIFILFALMAITDGIKGILKLNSDATPNWEKTVGTLQNIEFVDNLELLAEYNFNWQNKSYTHTYSEIAQPDTGKRNLLNLIYEQSKNARKISIWVNPKNLSESSIFPLVQNQLSKSFYSIQFGIAMLIFPGGLLIFIWGLKYSEKEVDDNIKIIEFI